MKARKWEVQTIRVVTEVVDFGKVIDVKQAKNSYFENTVKEKIIVDVDVPQVLRSLTPMF